MCISGWKVRSDIYRSGSQCAATAALTGPLTDLGFYWFCQNTCQSSTCWFTEVVMGLYCHTANGETEAYSGN